MVDEQLLPNVATAAAVGNEELAQRVGEPCESQAVKEEAIAPRDGFHQGAEGGTLADERLEAARVDQRVDKNIEA